jgi:sirohydrochlorin cobaltochelatase
MVTSEQMSGDEPFSFGELRISYEAGMAVVAGPEGVGEASDVEGSPAALRRHVRFDDYGRYRPLAGARSLPHGWRARCRTVELPFLLDEIYPLALRHSEQWAAGTLRVVPLDDVLTRQTGRYAVAAELDGRGRETAARVLCAACVKIPVWRGDRPGDDQIPCPEPCSMLVSLCREAALWQREPPAPGAPNPRIAFAGFDAPRNELREAYLAARYGHG